MFKFNIEEFSYKNYVLTMDFGSNKIMTGSFYNEDSIISEYYKNKKEMSDGMDLDVDSTHVSSNSYNENGNTTSGINNGGNKTLSFLSIISKEDDKIYKTLLEVDTIIITNLQEMLMLPYYFKKFNFNNSDNLNNYENSKFKIISTEPIIKIAKHYLKELYNNLNK